MVRRPGSCRSRDSKAALWPGKGCRTAHMERRSRFSNFRFPFSLPVAPEPNVRQTRSHLVLSLRILPRPIGGAAALPTRIPSRPEGVLNLAVAASLNSRVQNFENGPLMVTTPLSSFPRFACRPLGLGPGSSREGCVAIAMPCRRSPPPGADAEGET